MTRSVTDSHLHIWDLAESPQSWIDSRTMPRIHRDFLLADAIEVTNAAGTDGFFLVQTQNSTHETLSFQQQSGSPHVRGVIGWVDLDGDAAADLALLRGAGGGEALVGIRHLAHLESDDRWLLRPAVSRALHMLAEEDLAFDVVVRPWQLKQAHAMASAHPSLRIVLDHLGNPPSSSEGLARWRRDMELLAELDNVVAKLSGLGDPWVSTSGSAPLLPALVDQVLRWFGPDRLMFGSDWPLVELGPGYRRWFDLYIESTASLSGHEHLSIDSATAERTYRRTL